MRLTVRCTCLFTVALLVSSNAFAAADLAGAVEAAFSRVFGADVVHDFKDIAIDDSAIAQVKQLSGWRYGKHVALHIAKKGTHTLGYGLVDDVPGKEQPITYALFVNADGTVRDLEVLFYREAYGGEIKNESWREQFKGKSFDRSIRVGDAIQNISGATISTNAVTFGVRKLLAVLSVLRDRGMMP